MIRRLDPDELYLGCETEAMEFASTSEITCERGTIGQERAMRALDFGLSLDGKGFNIFMLGASGTGKMTTIKALLKDLSAKEQVPDDWCYVFNFKDPDQPMAISLPPGMGAEFKADMRELIKTLRAEVPKVFESKEYERQKGATAERFQRQQKGLFGELEEDVKGKSFSIRKSVGGLVIVPIKEDGEPLTEDEFERLEDGRKEGIEGMGKAFQERLDDIVRSVRGQEKRLKEELTQLEREAALGAVGHFIEELGQKYDGHDKVAAYLQGVQEDILSSLDDFKSQEPEPSPLPFMRPQKGEPSFTRYEVNVLVNHAETEGAPCVFESNPTYYNLFGRIEHRFQYGVAETDFSMIKGGSLHRANGGYLVVDAMDMLRNLFSYDALKRAIRNREVRMDDIWEQYRLVSTTTLKPEAIPLDVKIVLHGGSQLYYLLYNLDEEYRELFKVKADFEASMPRDECTILKYGEFIASKCEEEGLMPFDRQGVARVVEHGSRLAEHRGKLSSKFTLIADLVREAAYWARKDGASTVGRAHVERAIEERVYRSNRIEDRLNEAMLEDSLIVRTSGDAVGQVNGLAVLSLGDYTFGKPSRITATTYAGRAGVMHIERETKMSGKIHDKAVLIIQNYLGRMYARRTPLSLSASITFEQLYDMIEGDSATCAEFYALLSSLSEAPIRQGYAVTGSMDQSGEVQPIGGVNEKIEGFFDLCRLRGLDGSHGVIVPRRNLQNLMLKRDVVEAVRKGMFAVHAIDRVEDAVELLMGMPAGDADAGGSYPPGSVNHLVMKRLDEISEALRARGEQGPDGGAGIRPQGGRDDEGGCGGGCNR